MNDGYWQAIAIITITLLVIANMGMLIRAYSIHYHQDTRDGFAYSPLRHDE